jgi:RND family efflux transporter MFP subunit
MRVDESQERELNPPAQARRPRLPRALTAVLILLLLVGGAALGMAIYTGIQKRVAAEKTLQVETHTASVQFVTVTRPQPRAPNQDLVLPGTVQAFIDAPIYARTNGYLKKWYVDIGTHVQAHQPLAEIEAPEVDHELQQARADLETAQANYNLAKTTAARYQFLLKSQSVSKQETDEKVGDMDAKKAIVDAATSNVKRLEDLQSYEKVYAPFAGVITARETDIGDLITAGSSSSSKEMYHLADISRVRVFVNVPEQDRRSAREGTRATLTLNEFPGRAFTGTVVRNSESIDPASRTLMVEVDVNNPTGELLPGAYVTVHFKLAEGTGHSLIIPVDTVLFRSEGMRVAVVRNGRAELAPITVGRDFGNQLEIVAGLSPDDRIIVNPPDSLVSGTPVQVAQSSGARSH